MFQNQFKGIKDAKKGSPKVVYFMRCKVVQKVVMYLFALVVSKFMRQVYVFRIARQINFFTAR